MTFRCQPNTWSSHGCLQHSVQCGRGNGVSRGRRIQGTEMRLILNLMLAQGDCHRRPTAGYCPGLTENITYGYSGALCWIQGL